ncbi:aminotransferase class III-fold pyridoxal phosphate-dependent enzyme [Streptomyces sp. LHD-70]|uniref:aminotransferase class III-fold pyridoxal phosphate-dependent enzyme n=1 Tax=Streptomyces sp. LHD-70 TaxID=3072140 RepID=UPI0035BE6DE8
MRAQQVEKVVAGASVVVEQASQLGLRERLQAVVVAQQGDKSPYGIVFIVDEVMTRFGRTGSWFVSADEGVVPDLLTFAKGVNSGYVPLGGVVIGDRVAEHLAHLPYPGGPTYSGLPLACAAAAAAITAGSGTASSTTPGA